MKAGRLHFNYIVIDLKFSEIPDYVTVSSCNVYSGESCGIILYYDGL